ncbi:SDR family NAD(P)-dependent oxidoreductase [Actinophytocola sp.]|uniref:SDR family NAD(P)-dependent oxidoreductase n=1 Tax=Actinophytocola sp. TaxID=1872138 RepID=UPI00389A70A3
MSVCLGPQAIPLRHQPRSLDGGTTSAHRFNDAVGRIAAPAYSVSKAAAFSLSQSLRALVAGQGVKVHAVLPGPVDTDMLGAPIYLGSGGWTSGLRPVPGVRGLPSNP